MIKGLILVLSLFASSIAFSNEEKNEIPDDKDVHTQFGTCHQEFLPANFNLFVWNIKKAEARDSWARDFEFFVPKSDIVLIQEGMIDSYMPKVLQRQKNFCWDFVTSFIEKDGDQTGVVNGSYAGPMMVHFLRSPGREPVIKTPKMVLVTEYALANSSDTLWVANIHGLNFVTDRLNKEQIEQVASFLKRHQGPLIFAGDFNSWNKNRLAYLDEILGRLQMHKLAFANDNRRFKLDHIYVRGLAPISTKLHNDIETSDHKPLSAVFRLK
ncbi:endonuclease/exonuclease/phosphatase family protein [Bdellovibrio sp.]|uniref:endonuclease/exonuclease/phosphatase family protein n=1 Tax=Bdellovibrio TaxID=958 RepID=UPI003221E8F4